MKKRGRKKKIEADPLLQTRIVEYLSTGLTDAMTCAQAGISQDTFYTYINTIPEFSEAVTQARQKAHILAVITLRKNMDKQETVDVENETFTETRLKKDGTEYTYTRTVTRRKTIQHPADWRAAVEWLKRRDRDNWTDKQILQVDDWRSEVIELLKAGKVTPQQVEAELGKSLASELFNSIGITVTTTGEG